MNQSIAAFDYPLDPSFIAAAPRAERDQSRLLIYDRKRQQMAHSYFTALADILRPSDLLVLNDTRVFAARILARKKSGVRRELLFLRPLKDRADYINGRFTEYWEVLVKGKEAGETDLFFEDGAEGRLIRDLGGGRRALGLRLPTDRYQDIYAFLEKWGEVPLPPYIVKRRKKGEFHLNDRDRYQTVYAKAWGSAAAPTAGLHFTPQLIRAIRERGIQTADVTLHIGLDTFQPIRSELIQDHEMHREWYQVTAGTADLINTTRKRGGRVIAVGTTVVRVLESVSEMDRSVRAGEGETGLFITPGYRFKGIDALITNFHLPRSTLLLLVSAFAGVPAIRRVYLEAILSRYRFYSYGDAMFIV